MWQTVVVVVIVAASAVYATWLLLPAPVRSRLAGRLAARLPSGRLRAWLERKARPTAPPAGCDACPQTRLHDPRPGNPPPAP